MQLLFLLFTVCLSFAITGTYAQDELELKARGEAFIKEISQRFNIHKLESGLLVEILKTSDKADAKSPNVDDSCACTYSGTFMDGQIFDPKSSNKMLVFKPNQVIKGWREAMQLMVEGDKWRLFMPYNLAFGEKGRPPQIPAYSPLVIDVEMHAVNGTGKPLALARDMFMDSLAEIRTDL